MLFSCNKIRNITADKYIMVYYDEDLQKEQKRVIKANSNIAAYDSAYKYMVAVRIVYNKLNKSVYIDNIPKPSLYDKNGQYVLIPDSNKTPIEIKWNKHIK